MHARCARGLWEIRAADIRFARRHEVQIVNDAVRHGRCRRSLRAGTRALLRRRTRPDDRRHHRAVAASMSGVALNDACATPAGRRYYMKTLAIMPTTQNAMA